MKNIYISCPYSESTKLAEVTGFLNKNLKDLINKDLVKINYSNKNTSYDITKLEKSDLVIFVLEKYSFQMCLEKMTRGIISELMWCLNNRVPIFLAYKSSKGLQIYGAEITDDLKFTGIANTGNTICDIMNFLESNKCKLYVDNSDTKVATYNIDTNYNIVKTNYFY